MEFLEQYGETEATITELNELSSVKERLNQRYVGLNNKYFTESDGNSTHCSSSYARVMNESDPKSASNDWFC